jgi:hypothetical protein
MQQNLQQVEASLRRWHTRLTRATNAIRKLEAKRRRLSGPTRPKTLADRSPRNDKGISGTISKTPPIPDTIPLPELDAFFQRGRAAQAAVDELTVPAFLDRRDPVVAEEMTKARKAKEADARKAMPLTGKAALAKIKSKK